MVGPPYVARCKKCRNRCRICVTRLTRASRGLCPPRYSSAASLMRLPAAVTDVLVSALLAAAAIIAVTGGGRIRVAGAMVSAQSWSRPLAAAIVLFVVSQAPGLARRRVGAGKV